MPTRGPSIIHAPLAVAGALIVLGAAWISPLGGLAHELFTSHMARHLVVMNVAAVFMALAWQAGKPPRAALPLATALQMAALWLWHMPAMFPPPTIASPCKASCRCRCLPRRCCFGGAFLITPPPSGIGYSPC